MQVVNIADTGIFRAIGKPPTQHHDTLKKIITDDPETIIQLPRPIYRELGGDPDADPHPTGSSYVDTGIEQGWISVADPIEDEPPVSDAMRDAEHVMKAEIAHPKTIVLEEDLSLIALAIQLFDRAESLHVNIFTTDKPLQKAAAVVIQYYGYYDCDVYFAPPQKVYSELLHSEHFTVGHRAGR
jgi:hypothetical protein